MVLKSALLASYQDNTLTHVNAKSVRYRTITFSDMLVFVLERQNQLKEGVNVNLFIF